MRRSRGPGHGILTPRRSEPAHVWHRRMARYIGLASSCEVYNHSFELCPHRSQQPGAYLARTCCGQHTLISLTMRSHQICCVPSAMEDSVATRDLALPPEDNAPAPGEPSAVAEPRLMRYSTLLPHCFPKCALRAR